MAMTLADVRAKYPQYKDVDDKRLADALYAKYYPHAERREFDARIGLDPYQNMGQAALTAIQNVPASVTESKYALGEMAARAVGDLADPRTRSGNTPPLQVTPGAPIEDLLNQPAGIDQPAPGMGAPLTEAEKAAGGPDVWARAATTAGSLLPEDAKRAVAESAARTELSQKMRGMEARKALAANPVDVAPGSPEAIAAGAAASVVEMAAPAVLSALVKNPAPLVAYFTARGAGTGYSEAVKAGAPPDKARLAAALYGAAETVTEAVAGKVFVEGGKTLVRSVLKGAGVEGLTEGVTEALQALVDSGVIGEEVTLDQALERIRTASLTGAVAGAPIAGVMHGLRDGGKEATPDITVHEPVVPPPPDTPIEDRLALPSPGTLLALPSPDAFQTPEMTRRQPAAPVRTEPAPPTEDEIDYQARIALGRTKQAETRELLQTARETITPLGTFTPAEIGADAAGRVRQRRVQTGKPVEAPVTIEEMAAAKVPQRQIDAIIAARRPVSSEAPLTALDILRTAETKNIIADDGAFEQLALRTTGQKNIRRMTQAQLNALKSVLETMPSHAAPVTLPIAEQPGFTEEHYGKALDALRKQGRYTAGAIKDATGLRDNKDVRSLRDAMVRRGQLVQRSPSDFRLYDVLGEERQSVPDDLPAGAFKEHVVRRIPVSKIRISQDGKSIGTFGSATEARTKIREIRAAEAAKGGASAALSLEPAGDVAWGVMENRYDAEGNLLGQVVVDSYRDETEAQRIAGQLNTPDTGARYTQTPVQSVQAPAAPRQIVPAALEGRLPEILKRLNTLAKDRKLPLLGVRVTVAPKVAAQGQHMAGLYWNKLIKVSAERLTPEMSTDEIVEALGQIMDHETIHALRETGVLGPETDGWKTILRYAKRARVPGTGETYFERARRMYTGTPGYANPDTIEEEAIAEAFRYWAANRRNVIGQPATVFRQIVEWFKRLMSSIPEDVFKSIESGSLVEGALRPPGAGMPRATATRAMEQSAAEAGTAQAAADENLVRVKSREFLRARAQAREDRYGRSGPKTVIGTTPSKAYATGEVGLPPRLEEAVAGYRSGSGIQIPQLRAYLPDPIDYQMRVADAQQKAVHNPKANDVAKAYRALVDETRAMFKALGPLEISAWKGEGQPYTSPAEMLADIAAGQLRMRLSDDLFGPGADNAGHPMNEPSGVKAVTGEVLTNNDLFRIVHDVYGHGQSGFRDNPRGAYNAYHEHARLLSPEARRALATETLAQGAWANYGPHLRRRDGTVPRETDVDYLPPAQKEFAEQKAFVLPIDLLGADPGLGLAAKADGLNETPRFMIAWHGTPHIFDKFDSSKIGTGEGAQAFGHGLYFAGRKEVADWYRKTLTDGGMDRDITFKGEQLRGTQSQTPEVRAARLVGRNILHQGHDYNFAEAVADAKYSVSGNVKMDPSDQFWDVYQALDTMKESDFGVPPLDRGRLLTVDIPDDSELMVWDAPLSENPAVLEKLRQAPEGGPVSDTFKDIARDPGTATGEQFYNRLVTHAGSDAAASAALREAGIPGHRYLEGNSRSKPAAIASMKRDLAAWEGRLKDAPDDTYVKGEVEARRQEVADAEKGIAHNYVIYDDSRIKIIDEPKFAKFDDSLPGGRLYGNPNRSPGGALSSPETPIASFSEDRPGNRFFGGEMAEEQLRMAREGARGTTMIYMPPEDFLALAGDSTNPEQEVYDDALAAGYKASFMPSLVIDGYAGNVRASAADGAEIVRALGTADSIPVILYPKKGKEGLGLVTAIERGKARVPWSSDGRAEKFAWFKDEGGDVTENPLFQRWFGSSKVVDAEGKPLVVYRGDFPGLDQFDGGVRAQAMLKGNIIFSDKPEIAERYRRQVGDVYPAYLALKNPWVTDAKGASWLDIPTPDKLREEFGDSEKTGQIDYVAEWIRKNMPEHDGMIVRNVDDQWGMGDQYVAFDSTQIKSVNNRGTFDPEDPRIRYSLNAPFGQRVPQPGVNTPPQNDQFNIIHQRTEGWVGKALQGIGRKKTDIPLIGGMLDAAGLGGNVFDMRVALQDSQLSVKEFLEYLREHQGDVPNDLNAYVLQQAVGSRAFHGIEERETTTYKPLFDALQAAAKPATGPAVTPKEVELYLYARHAPERNAVLRAKGSKEPNPSGMSDAEASSVMDQFALDGKLPALETVAAQFDAITADTTRTRLEGGLITPEMAASQLYQHYAPMRDGEDSDPFEEKAGGPRKARSGRGLAVSGREDRPTVGRGSKAGDLIGNAILQNIEAVIRAEKNRVGNALLETVQMNKAMAEPFIKVIQSAPTKQVVDSSGMIRTIADPAYRQDTEKYFITKVRGKEVVMEIGDPRLARALNSDQIDKLGPVMAGLNRIMRFIAAVRTSRNPSFLITNFARDFGAAVANSSQYDVPQMSLRTAAGVPAAAKGIAEVEFKGTATSPHALAYREMQENGWTIEFMGLHDLESIVRRAQLDAGSTSGLKLTARQVRNRIENIFAVWDSANNVVENSLRVSAYMEARRAGASITEAGYLAKNLTVNFNKGGEKKALVNTFYLFYNASAQAGVVTLNLLKNKRGQKIVAGLVAFGFAADLLNRIMSGDDNDNGIKDYDEINDYTLEHSLIIPNPGRLFNPNMPAYLKWPLPLGLNVFFNAGRNLSNMTSGSPAHPPLKSLLNIFTAAMDSFNPVGGGSNFLNFVAPTFMDPFIEVLRNKDYADRPIMPTQSGFGVPQPDSQLYWNNTDKPFVDAAVTINRLTGGNEVRKGAVDMSPEHLEYVFDYILGGTGQFVMDVGYTGAEAVPRALTGSFETIEANRIPFVKALIGSDSNRGNAEQFYRIRDEVRTVEAELKLFAETGDRLRYEARVKASPTEVRLIDFTKKVQDALSALRKQIELVREAPSIPADKKRTQIDELKKRQNEIMAQYVKTFYSMGKPAQ